MARQPQAQDLTQRVAFDRREEINPDFPDDLGNTVSGWVEQFQARAAFIHLRGGETVMAGRLQGRHTQIIRVRSSSLSRSVSTDWRVRDARSGVAYNIRDISPDEETRMWIDLLCERGVAN